LFSPVPTTIIVLLLLLLLLLCIILRARCTHLYFSRAGVLANINYYYYYYYFDYRVRMVVSRFREDKRYDNIISRDASQHGCRVVHFNGFLHVSHSLTRTRDRRNNFVVFDYVPGNRDLIKR
jgi:hypothetical protein